MINRGERMPIADACISLLLKMDGGMRLRDGSVCVCQRRDKKIERATYRHHQRKSKASINNSRI